MPQRVYFDLAGSVHYTLLWLAGLLLACWPLGMDHTTPTLVVNVDFSQVIMGTSPGLGVLLPIGKAQVQSGLRQGLRMAGLNVVAHRQARDPTPKEKFHLLCGKWLKQAIAEFRNDMEKL